MPGGSQEAEFPVTAGFETGASLAQSGIDVAATDAPGKAQGAPWIQVTASLQDDAASHKPADGQPGEAIAVSAEDFGEAAPGESSIGNPLDLPVREEVAIAGRRDTETAATHLERQTVFGNRAAGSGGELSPREQPGSLGMSFAGRYATVPGAASGSPGGSAADSGFGDRGSGAEAQGRQPSSGNAQTRLTPAVAGEPAPVEETDGGFTRQTTASDGSPRAGFAVQGPESVAGSDRTAGDSMPVGVQAGRPAARIANGSPGGRLDAASAAAREAGLELEAARTQGSTAPARSVRVDLPGDAGAESLRLRFLQRGIGNASAIDVRIQGASEQGVREIRAEIPALLERMESAGFRTAASTEGGSTLMDERGASREGTPSRHGAWSGPGPGESGSGHGQGDEQPPSRSPSPGAGDGMAARRRRTPFDFQEALRTLAGAAPTHSTDPRGHQEGQNR
jgi:hypothetical protein